jgi:two-component system, response regulator, stage 0 sporulation protein F
MKEIKDMQEMKEKILYVDDEPMNLELFSLTFSRLYTVITAKNGFEGLDMLDQNPGIKAVISDMKMPKMNGLQFIAAAKEKHQNIKYFILTGFDITREIQEAIDKGLVVKYFRKPFNMKEIEASIRETFC